MSYLLIALAAISIIMFVLWLHARKQAATHGTSPREELAGICTAAVDQSIRKRRNKARIMELFEKHDELSNSDIREQLDVSRRSVTNYTTELEKEGKLQQVGDAGRGVVYRLQ